ncbi:MAG: WYL domain-containing protein [Bacteroidia bacterium]|jgi:predicted DNA-binding transcriptional regulator YafY|nr:WYL domain-containing protein [Bacteroidia bacterium]
MPKNKNAFIRYRIIDGALRNKHKKFPSKQELIEACSGLGKVSARTIDHDIYDMKHDEELGYFAPILYSYKENGYYYSDPNYSINNLPLKQEDIYALEFACSLLKQFEGISTVKQFMQSVEKIEDYVNLRNVYGNDDFMEVIETEQGVIQKGSEYLGVLLKHIKEQESSILHYDSINSKSIKIYHIHPYVLKEYRNRWYVVGWVTEKEKMQIFALDRIKSIVPGKQSFTRLSKFSPADYFKYSFGISVLEHTPENVVLHFSPSEAPYIKSLPLHHSQTILQDDEKAFIIQLTVAPSYELLAQILGYGEKVVIIQPESLKQKHIQALKSALLKYEQHS